VNRLSGEISSIVTVGAVSRVGIGIAGATLSAVVLETPETAPWLRTGGKIVCLFKETEVGLARTLTSPVTFGNRLEGVVESADHGELFTRVRLTCPAGTFTALVGAAEAGAMEIRGGETLTALIHPGEITLMVPDGPDAL